MLKQTGAFAAEIVNSNRAGLAALAAERLLSDHPAAAARYQPQPTSKWRESFASRLTYLAAALSTGRPELFAAQAAWAKVATQARAGQEAVNDLEKGFVALKSTLCAQMPEDTLPFITQYLDAAIREFRSAPDHVPSTLSVATPQGKLAAQYLLAVLEGDRHRACRLIFEPVQSGTLSIREAYLEVLQPVQVELGRLWHMNESTVAEEHFCTATTQMLMSQLALHMPRAPRHGKTVVAASVEHNAHDLGIRMIADFLEMDGWKAVYLGASVPPDDLALAVVDFSADLLCLSAGISPQLTAVTESIAAVRRGPFGVHHPRSDSVKILVGGLAFTTAASSGFSGSDHRDARAAAAELAISLGADAYAASPDDAVRAARVLCDLSSQPSSPPPTARA